MSSLPDIKRIVQGATNTHTQTHKLAWSFCNFRLALQYILDDYLPAPHSTKMTHATFRKGWWLRVIFGTPLHELFSAHSPSSVSPGPGSFSSHLDPIPKAMQMALEFGRSETVLLWTDGGRLLLETLQINNGPLTRYVKLRVTHAPGRPGTVSSQRG